MGASLTRITVLRPLFCARVLRLRRRKTAMYQWPHSAPPSPSLDRPKYLVSTCGKLREVNILFEGKP